MLAWQELDLRTDPLEPRYEGDPADVLEAWAELLALARRPWWHQHAACRGHGVAVFFTTRGEDTEPAKAVCAGCTVRDECLATSLAVSSADDGGGIWGGTSLKQRRQLRRSAQGVTPAA